MRATKATRTKAIYKPTRKTGTALTPKQFFTYAIKCLEQPKCGSFNMSKFYIERTGITQTTPYQPFMVESYCDTSACAAGEIALHLGINQHKHVMVIIRGWVRNRTTDDQDYWMINTVLIQLFVSKLVYGTLKRITVTKQQVINEFHTCKSFKSWMQVRDFLNSKERKLINSLKH